ncbi:MAG TPA: NTP transferase domain-containing protein [Rectinemataceae bacterium]|nr:NTP transferase domain-containing protein [Rectinemataceae bacterium]
MGKTALLVLAAGMGSRFGGPKQAAPVGPSGETLLEYSIYDALRAGFDELVFLIGREAEPAFRERVLACLPARVPWRLAFQELDSLMDGRAAARARASGRTKPWGTGQALLCAASGLELPFASVNADDFYGSESFRVVHDFLEGGSPGGASWCMAGFALANTLSPNGPVSRGICSIDEAGLLMGVTEQRQIGAGGPGEGIVAARAEGGSLGLTGRETVSMNLWGLTPSVLGPGLELFGEFLEQNAGSATAEFGLPDMVDALMARGVAKVRVLPTAETWFGLTYRADLAESRSRIEELTRSGSYPSPLWGT